MGDFVFAGNLGNRLNIGQFQGGIGRCLGEDQPCIVHNRIAYILRVGGIDETEFDPEPTQYSSRDPVCTAVDNVGQDRVLACVQQRHHYDAGRRHAGGVWAIGCRFVATSRH